MQIKVDVCESSNLQAHRDFDCKSPRVGRCVDSKSRCLQALLQARHFHRMGSRISRTDRTRICSSSRIPYQTKKRFQHIPLFTKTAYLKSFVKSPTLLTMIVECYGGIKISSMSSMNCPKASSTFISRNPNPTKIHVAI